MIDLTTAENALKDVYLGVIANQLNEKTDPVWRRIRKSSNDVYGKEIRVLPSWIGRYKEKCPVLSSELKTIYGKVEISDKAIRCSINSSGAFVNLLNSEMENLISSTQKRLRDALYNEDKAPEYLPEKLKENYQPLVITGFKEIFSNSESLYGLSRNEYHELNPRVEHIKGFDFYKVQEIIDNYCENATFIVCNAKFRREYMESQRFSSIEDLGGGFKALMFNNMIPIIVNYTIPENEIYIIDINDFTFHQLCDWQWISDTNNRVLKQKQGLPMYECDLVKYGDLICDNPSKQIKIIINE